MSPDSVKSWRDDVSFKLGQIMESQKNMHADIKKTNGKVGSNENRIGALEQIESNRKAVQRHWACIWAVVGGAVVWALQKLAPLAWSLFK